MSIRVNNLVSTIKGSLEDGKMSLDDITTIAILLMKEAATFKELTGIQKKKVVLEAIRVVLRECGKDDTAVDALEIVIDSVYAVSKVVGVKPSCCF